jgi:hypothetical protein
MLNGKESFDRMCPSWSASTPVRLGVPFNRQFYGEREVTNPASRALNWKTRAVSGILVLARIPAIAVAVKRCIRVPPYLLYLISAYLFTRFSG